MVIYRRRDKNVLNIFEVCTSIAIYIKIKTIGKGRGQRPERPIHLIEIQKGEHYPKKEHHIPLKKPRENLNS